MAACTGLYAYEELQKIEIQNGSRTARRILENIRKHFVVSLEAVREGRYYTLLTSSFAHANGWHLFLNMWAVLGFGTTFIQLFGLPHFAAIWVGSAVLGAAAQLGYWQKYERTSIREEAVGASGAIFGVVSALAVVCPWIRISLLFVPLSVRAGMILSAGLSVAAINKNWFPEVGLSFPFR